MTDNFKIIDNILFRKKHVELFMGDDCSPWVINKGVSFHTPLLAAMVNVTTNSYHTVLDKQEQIDLLNLLVPRMNYSKTKWIKSAKKTKESHDDLLQAAKNLEMSSRELNDILEVLPEFHDELVCDDSLKTYKTKSK